VPDGLKGKFTGKVEYDPGFEITIDDATFTID